MRAGRRAGPRQQQQQQWTVQPAACRRCEPSPHPRRPEVLRACRRPTDARRRRDADRVRASGINRPTCCSARACTPCRRASDLPGWRSPARWWRRCGRTCRCGLHATGLCAGGRRGYAELAPPRFPRCPAPLRRPDGISRRQPARDLLHRLVERVRPRDAKSGETLLVRAGPAASASPPSSWPRRWAHGHRHRGQRRQVRGLRGAGRDHAINYRTQDFVAGSEAPPTRRRRGARHGRAATTSARSNALADDGRLVIIAAGRHEERHQQATCCASAWRSPARRRVRAAVAYLRPPRPRTARQGLAADRGRPHPPGDPPGVPGAGGGGACADGIEHHVGKIVLDWTDPG